MTSSSSASSSPRLRKGRNQNNNQTTKRKLHQQQRQLQQETATSSSSPLPSDNLDPDTTLTGAIGEGLSTAGNAMGDAIANTSMEDVTSAVGTAAEVVGDTVMDVGGTVVDAAGNAIAIASNTTTMEDVASAVGSAAGVVAEGVGSAVDTVGDVAGAIEDSDAGQAVGDVVGGAVGAVGDWMGGGDGSGGGGEQSPEFIAATSGLESASSMDGVSSLEGGSTTSEGGGVDGMEGGDGGGDGEDAATGAVIQSIHHHMVLCPGFESTQVKGYADLESLRMDLDNYFRFVKDSSSTSSASGDLAGGAVDDTDGGIGEGGTTEGNEGTPSDLGTGPTSLNSSNYLGTGPTPTSLIDSNTNNINATGKDDTTGMPMVCTDDVFTCNDSSFVSRNPMKYCEFDPCGDGTQVPLPVGAEVVDITVGGSNGTQHDDGYYNMNGTDTGGDIMGNSNGTEAIIEDIDNEDLGGWDDGSELSINPEEGGEGGKRPTDCNDDVFQCNDFTFVHRDPSLGCYFIPCLDETEIPVEMNEMANSAEEWDGGDLGDFDMEGMEGMGVNDEVLESGMTTVACKKDFFQCDDFSLVSRDPMNGCVFGPCPDGTEIPEEEAGAGIDSDALDGGDGVDGVDVLGTVVPATAGGFPTLPAGMSTTAAAGTTVFATPAAGGVRKRDRTRTSSEEETGRRLRGLQEDQTVEEGGGEEVVDMLGTSATVTAFATMAAEIEGDASGLVVSGVVSTTASPADSDEESTSGDNDGGDNLIQAGTDLVFDICPNTRFEFTDLLTEESLKPLVVNTPVKNPIWINCRKDLLGEDPSATKDACVFTGGKIHMVLNHLAIDGMDNNAEINFSGDHLVTIRGVTFREASETSLLMADPHGQIAIEDCHFEGNSGMATIKIDGKYDSVVEAAKEWWAPEEMEVVSDGDDGEDVVITGSTVAPGTPGTTASFDEIVGALTTSSPPEFDEFSTNDTLLDPTFNYTNGTDGIIGGNETDGNIGKNETGSGNDGNYTVTTNPTEPFGPSTALFSLTSSTSSAMFLYSSTELPSTPFSTPGRDLRRSLEVGSLPSSKITIRLCSFNGNNGDATIMISSYVDELSAEEQDPGTLTLADDLFDAEPDVRAGDAPHSHSIHVALEDSTFTGENAGTAVIMNDGGRLQSSYCRFVGNAAGSIIKTESGTLAMEGNEFSDNAITEEGGPVQLDTDTMLEANEGNCAKADPGVETNTANGESTEESSDTFISARQGLISTVNAAGKSEEVPSNVTEVDEEVYTCGVSVMGTCVADFGETCRIENDPLADCLDSWEDLVSAVSERSQTDPDFIVCPGVTLDVGANGPVIIDADFTSIKCGADGLSSESCTITGGFSHFQIIGSPEGVQLSGLTLKSSSGASVIAGGSTDATLRLNDCIWTLNFGASAVLIRDDSLSEFNGDYALMLESSAPAMTVEIRDSEFTENLLTHATVSSMGGNVVIYRTRFDNNKAEDGDVVVTKSGSCKLQENCFKSHTSTSPGTIFMQEGASLSGNTNNFGKLNSAGSFSEGRCNDIFHETGGTNCLGTNTTCGGFCMPFEALSCPLDETEEEVAESGVPDKGGIKINTNPELESGGKKSLTPIIVATLVAAFVVFGMGIIIMRRKKKNKNSAPDLGNSRSRGGSKFGFLSKFKKKKAHDTSAYEMEDEDDL